MKDKIRSYKMYPAWEYEKEEEDLNKASWKGYQLVKGGCFHSVFQRDNTVRYNYQLDYNLHIDDPVRYKEVFQEQGWEYINSTFNGWHYFRKLYQEGQTLEDTKIYTDKQSLYEMQGRWIKLMFGLIILYVTMIIVYTVLAISNREYILFVDVGISIVFSSMFSIALFNIKRGRQGKKKIFNIPIQLAMIICIVLIIIMCIL